MALNLERNIFVTEEHSIALVFQARQKSLLLYKELLQMSAIVGHCLKNPPRSATQQKTCLVIVLLASRHS